MLGQSNNSSIRLVTEVFAEPAIEDTFAQASMRQEPWGTRRAPSVKKRGCNCFHDLISNTKRAKQVEKSVETLSKQVGRLQLDDDQLGFKGSVVSLQSIARRDTERQIFCRAHTMER